MRVVVTGGAGFIGRWVVRAFLGRGWDVVAFDNLSSGSRENIAEFVGETGRFRFVKGDVRDADAVRSLLAGGTDLIAHLAARINVQQSIDHPVDTFENDVTGTLNLLEAARAARPKFLFMSTCMVYDRSSSPEGIGETHPTKPASPYAACKLAGEQLTLSYHHAYGLPAVVVRPFNTYGPFQRADGEGGVIAVFLKKAMARAPLQIYGDGTQTRDFLYAEDCAEFVATAALSREAEGRILNAGTGRDISVNDLAALVQKDPALVRHVPHIHPQSEIAKLLCDAREARRILGWEPRVSLAEGIRRTGEWLAARPSA